MATYVYVTSQCRKDTKQQQYGSEVDGFGKKIESQHDSDGFFQRYPPPFLKKRFEKQIRLVAAEYLVGDHVVIGFLRLLVRGGKEYRRFMDSDYQELPGLDRMAGELTSQSLQAYVDSRKDPPPPPPPKPAPDEEVYLHSALNCSENIYQDHHCCETKLWVDAMISPQFADRRNIFVDAVLETIDHNEHGLAVAKCKSDSRFGILFRRIPEQKMVILFTPFKGDPPIAAVRAMYPDLLAKNAPDRQVVLKKTKRAYPQELILNEDAWIQVQKDQEGNMALSLEEIEVLESARKSEGGYPLFINGSAGSGKSTILQYLFTEYLFHHLESGKSSSGPVLFACNDQLLARTNSSVRSILQIRHGRKPGSTGQAESWIEHNARAVGDSLKNFHKWLASLVPLGRFQPGSLIDYGRFKLWWKSRFHHEPSAGKLYNADISWHVIRTYIKGFDPENYLDHDDYLEIATKRKSVTPETYQIVFDKVWKRYQEDQKQHSFWDHQDLTRYVLKHNLIKAEHPVVFCDEAQDFTRIELEALHRHCLFYKRSLHTYQMPQIPVAFAGDPFQTLNPTGFRWEATKAFFTDKFTKNFPGQKQRDINYQELTYNYRSTHHIVRFNNSIQLIRSLVFGFPEIKPQHPWVDQEDVPSVSYFDRSDVGVLKSLKAQSEIRIVVPCEEGFEGEWAKENGLAEFVEFDDAGVPKNVVSPMGVKGLEFPRVVLFGFAGTCPPTLRKAILDPSVELAGDQAIEPQYFLNRLYVGASRPRKRLFIIDSDADIQAFWIPIFSDPENYILRSKSPAAWDRMTGQIIKGSPASWEGDREDPIETAEKLATEGRLRKDRILLRQASQSYAAAGKRAEATMCRAEALELESNFVDAAKFWQELGEFDKSLIAAWNARQDGYKFIMLLGQERPELKNRIHWKFVDFFEKNGGFNDGVVLVKELVDALQGQELLADIVTSSVWPGVIRDCLTRILQKDAKEFGMWALTYRNAANLSAHGVPLANEMLGELAFRGNLMPDAHRHWELVPAEQRGKFERRYLEAKAAVLPFPQSFDAIGELLRRFSEMRFANDLIALVQREGKDRLSDAQLAILARAHLVMGDSNPAFDDITRISDRAVLADLIEAASKAKAAEKREQAIRRIVEVLAAQEEWQEIWELLSTGRCKSIQVQELQRLAKRDVQTYAIPIIDCIALGYGIEKARNELKTDLAGWLREHFPSTFAWRHELHPMLLGRLFERAGMFRETLPYYEALADSKTMSVELRKLAWQRWARVKLQQSLRERENKATGRAEKAYKEAHEMAERLGLGSPEAIPEELTFPLPEVDAEPTEGVIEKPSEPSVPVAAPMSGGAPLAGSGRDYSRSLNVGKIQVRVSSDGHRVNLEHADTLEHASVQILQSIVTMEGKAIPIDEMNRAKIAPWGLVLDFDEIKDGKLNLKLDDGLEVSVPVTNSASK